MQSFVKQEVETHQKLFGEMLDRFGISAKPLAEKSSVSEVQLSRFRNGKTDLGAGKLMALLENVPHEAREWYLSQLLGVSLKTSLRSLVLSASPQEKAEVLNLIANWVENRDSTKLELVPEAVS
jgi:transcriptional regulator with XRE-family HTH domain